MRSTPPFPHKRCALGVKAGATGLHAIATRAAGAGHPWLAGQAATSGFSA